MPGTPSREKNIRIGSMKERFKREKNTGSDARAERGTVAVSARRAIQLATEEAIRLSTLSRQTVLLPSLFILVRNQLLHQVRGWTRMLTSSMARATGITGSQIVSGLERQRGDRTRATQGIKARS
jgi:hypothetical protein